MKELIYLIPAAVFVFTIADCVADAWVSRRPQISWWKWHIFT